MNLPQTRASLVIWKGKEKFRKTKHTLAQRAVNTARAKDSHPRQALVDARNTAARELRAAREMVRQRQREIVSLNRKHQKLAAAAHGVTTYDGVPVAAVAVRYLDWARAHGWQGHLVSGWRDPKYSQSLCYRICGAPRCPGKCAGTSSNHVGTDLHRFAVDVSDYVTFRRVIANCPYEPRIFNNLPVDPVHFSPNGQ
jgi:hypothetical protein